MSYVSSTPIFSSTFLGSIWVVSSDMFYYSDVFVARHSVWQKLIPLESQQNSMQKCSLEALPTACFSAHNFEKFASGDNI